MAASLSFTETATAGRFVDLQPVIARKCLKRRRAGLDVQLEKAIATLAVLEAPRAKEDDEELQCVSDWTEGFLNAFMERCRQCGGLVGEGFGLREECHADAVACAWFLNDAESALSAAIETREALLDVPISFDVRLRLAVGHHEYSAFTTIRRSEPNIIGVAPKLWAKLSQEQRERFASLGCSPPDDEEIARRAQLLLEGRVQAVRVGDTT